MNPRKAQIYASLERMTAANRAAQDALTREASLTDYVSHVRTGMQDDTEIRIWTDAFRAALAENEIVRIPASAEPYYVDDSITIPSNRRIFAEDGAVIRQMKGVRVLMFRNEHTADGTHAPIAADVRDCNIAICGGRWEESNTGRAGYGRTGMYDMERSFYGVSTCMFFNNMDGLTLTDLTFVHTAGFSVQMGDITNVLIDNITFVECFADGLHINGNTENVRITNVRGQVGDDLVALNMYDWQNSSVDFGPMKTVLCENLDLSADSHYKAMRIEPGVYYYDDNSSVDCGLYDAIIKNVRGINTFKLYYQTPAYRIIGGEPERGGPGSGDYLFFEDIKIDLNAPIDGFREYTESDPVRGAFAGFEFGANIGHLFFENIDLTLYPEKYPYSYLFCVGPKSCVTGNGTVEVFDPYVSCEVGTVELTDIRVNGVQPDDIAPYIRAVTFDNINNDNRSTGSGTIANVVYHK
ncbi:MAG: hypothetical protein E7579_02870 [Ruminococcaceae bacterium]|nr:hypothetical protein [Oscillospiraceae bacterium]